MKVLFALVMFVQMEAGDWKAARAQQFLTEKQCQEAGEMYKASYKNAVPNAVKHYYQCIELKGDEKAGSI